MISDATETRAQTSSSTRPYTTHSVTSKDGTTIGYRQLGHGPGLVIVHGMMEAAHSHMDLAELLADQFTVYLPDRRGRGMSGAYGEGYNVRKGVEDLDALLAQTGAHQVFGVSAGALVCLQAAFNLPAIHKVALFDPPLIVNGSVPTDFLTRYDREIARGDVPAALVTAMRGAQMGPSFFNFIPRWLMERMTASMLAKQDKGATADTVTMRQLAPTLRHDIGMAVELEDKLDRFKAMTTDVLLLGGSRSPAYMRLALDTLEHLLPRARRVEFAGLGHNASGNRDEWGKPEVVADALRQFFA